MQCSKGSLFKNGFGNLNIHIQKVNLDMDFILFIIVNSKCITDLSVKYNMVKIS